VVRFRDFGRTIFAEKKSRMRSGLRIVVALFWIVGTVPSLAQEQVTYRVSFPAPEHHYAQVELTFSGVSPTPLELRMSRSSPGRYALHEFAKNVFDVHAYDGRGKDLTATRPNPYQWDIAGHDGTVRILYKVYGDHIDGTYLGIDTTHAHMNMPATLMWARGLETRPARVQFVPPEGLGWTAATQLFPTSDPWTFTAPNLQYLMDSPTELSAQTLRSFKVRNPDGKEFTIRTAIHHDATDGDVDEYTSGVEKIVKEAAAVFAEFPQFDTGTYTFLGDYVPWGGGDGMEHRNSSVVAAGSSLRGAARRMLDTVAHEFFHAWNVERIRPRSLEPFNFEQANMSGELWLAEGFTQYYGGLIMHRAGLTGTEDAARQMALAVAAVASPPGGRQFRSAVEMSEMAPFTDAACAVDRTNFSTTVISYYTFGAAVALAMDLSLRERSNGRISLDDYMRAMWRVHGKPGGPQPGLVGMPYTRKDARDRLAEVSADPAFADEFFARYIEGRETPDYARLLTRAGFVLRKRNAGAGWIGELDLDATSTIENLVAAGTPAFDAGLDQGDTILHVDGKTVRRDEALQTALKSHRPGDRMTLELKRRNGAIATISVMVDEDPSTEVVTLESTGATLSAEQKTFRNGWLGSRSRSVK
jgi:predicted metalloprotease with PDZ domain